MAMIPSAIHQFSPGCDVGDGITNGMFFTRKILHSLGIPSEIFSIHIPEALQGIIHNYHEYRSQPDQVLLVHHSMGASEWDWVGQQTDIRIMIYHNITPAEFFAEGSFFRKYCILGRKQLADSVSWFVGAIGDSIYNSAELVECGYQPVVTIPLLIDLNQNLTVPWNHGVVQRYQDTFNLLFVGRIIENKHQHELIELFAEFKAFYRQPAKLLLVGGTTSVDYENRLRKLICDRQLQNEVELTGKVSSEHLYGYYRAADVFVCLSEHEGFGMPLIEAMCYDVPVVALDTSNIGNTLGESGILFTEKNLLEMAACLKLLAEHREFRRRVIRSQRRNLQRFTFTTVRDQLIAFLKQVGIVVATPPDSNLVSQGKEFDVPVQYQIEGPFDSSYSLALVNRELALALQKTGQTVALYSTEGPGDFLPNPDFLSACPAVTALWRNADNPWFPETVLRNLYPPRVADACGLTNVLGIYGWEESAFPAAYMADFNQHLDLVATMSNYVTNILIDNGLCRPCITVGIGVDHLLSVAPDPLKIVLPTGFRFLHNSSAFPRKGVDVLLAAWVKAFTARDPVALIIKTFPNPHNTVPEQLARLANEYPDHAPILLINEDLSPGAVINLYQQCQALVAPSRGEGFGLPMAEAMLFNLPVIVTGYGGQTDFCTDETAWLIDYQFARAQTHMNLYDSVWIEPSIDHLVALLREIFHSSADAIRQRTTIARQRLLARFTWRAVSERLHAAVQRLDRQPLFNRCLRLGWLSTWNVKCGIAAYSRYLVSHLDPTRVFVLANRTAELTQPDESNIFRCWNAGWQDTLDELVPLIRSLTLTSLVIQFNFGFFKLGVLERLIQQCHQDGIQLYLTLHSTADVDKPDFQASLGSIAVTLQRVQRIFVHSVSDLNRLKGFGLTQNVSLFPHGVSLPDVSLLSWPNPASLVPELSGRRIIAAYGFLLPHKGIASLIKAFAVLQREFPDLYLLLVNAHYPALESDVEQHRCQTLIQNLGIADHVTMINDFLTHEESLLLLNLAECIVFPYQNTQESSSAAVRHGLVANRPVFCSPLSIFDDVADAVLFLPGITVNDITQGLRNFLQAPERIKGQVQRQNQWLQVHDWGLLAQRLWNMLIGMSSVEQTRASLITGFQPHENLKKDMCQDETKVFREDEAYASRDEIMKIETNNCEPNFSNPVCQLLTFRQFIDPNFKKWACQEIGWQFGFNRKLWEYAFILNALDLNDKLGGRGLGFGVGREPIVPVMLRHGAQLLVSDLADAEAQAEGWLTMQFDVQANNTLNFRFIDMNKIPPDLTNYDFLWSCGSLEHIGGLRNGMKFVENAMTCLKPGGVAIHTTEFTLSSDDETFESSNLCFYRERDIKELIERLNSLGYNCKINLTRGQHQMDCMVFEEPPPWELSMRQYLCGHYITSIALVIYKPL